MLGNTLALALGKSARSLAIDPEYLSAGCWAGLRGKDVERIRRNRGEASVAPFAQLPDDLCAWLGYQEVWDLEAGRMPFVFRHSSVTVHVGEVGDPIKPQLLRLEWPGIRHWDRSGIGFQSPGAGHPHWQIDLLESMQEQDVLHNFSPDQEEEIESFETVVTPHTLSERISNLTFERMHLASAAPWWSSNPAQFGVHHIHAPSDLAQLTRWLDSAVSYIRQEVERRIEKRA